MYKLEEGTLIAAKSIDAGLDKLRIWFPAEVCRKHLVLFRSIGHAGILVAGCLGFIMAIIAAIQVDSLSLFLGGAGWLLAMVIVDYVSRRFGDVSEQLVKRTMSSLSSTVYIEAIALILLVASMALLGAGIYGGINASDLEIFLKVAAFAVWLFYVAVLSLNSVDLLNVHINPGLKAEEEGVGLLEFNAKSALLAVPFFFGTGIGFGLLSIVWGVTTRVSDGMDFGYAVLTTTPYFLVIGIIATLPFLACIVFLIAYMSFAAIKSLIRIAESVAKQ